MLFKTSTLTHVHVSKCLFSLNCTNTSSARTIGDKFLEPDRPMLQSKPSYKESPSLQDHQGFLDMIQLQLKNYKEYNNQPM